MPILRGDVYFVELGPTRGRELDAKRRPVVIVSINDINTKPLVVVGIPGKRHDPQKKVFQNQVLVVPSAANGLKNHTLFDCIQIKALDHNRFENDKAGVLSGEDLSAIERALARS